MLDTTPSPIKEFYFFFTVWRSVRSARFVDYPFNCVLDTSRRFRLSSVKETGWKRGTLTASSDYN